MRYYIHDSTLEYVVVSPNSCKGDIIRGMSLARNVKQERKNNGTFTFPWIYPFNTLGILSSRCYIHLILVDLMD